MLKVLRLLFIVQFNILFVMLKKRVLDCGFGGYNPDRVPFLSENEDGKREVLNLNPHGYFERCPRDYVEYSLTEELKAGVPLQQLSPSNLMQPSPEISEEQILETLEQQETQE